MRNVTEFGKKVKDQEKKLMENVSWIVGIDIGKLHKAGKNVIPAGC